MSKNKIDAIIAELEYAREHCKFMASEKNSCLWECDVNALTRAIDYLHGQKGTELHREPEPQKEYLYFASYISEIGGHMAGWGNATFWALKKIETSEQLQEVAEKIRAGEEGRVILMNLILLGEKEKTP